MEEIGSDESKFENVQISKYANGRFITLNAFSHLLIFTFAH